MKQVRIFHDVRMGHSCDQVKVDSGRMRIYTFSNYGHLRSWFLNISPRIPPYLEEE
jgi:hypothetical protein